MWSKPICINLNKDPLVGLNERVIERIIVFFFDEPLFIPNTFSALLFNICVSVWVQFSTTIKLIGSFMNKPKQINCYELLWITLKINPSKRPIIVFTIILKQQKVFEQYLIKTITFIFNRNWSETSAYSCEKKTYDDLWL